MLSYGTVKQAVRILKKVLLLKRRLIYFDRIVANSRKFMTVSLQDLAAQIKKSEEQTAQLRKQAEELRNHERTGIIDQVLQQIAEYGLTAADLKLAGRVSKVASTSQKTNKTPAPAKYRGPAGQTWSGGRGRKPGWITEALAIGKSLSDFEIS
ncbi:H-NS family nucleoid-associated regulatory protein [Variovorax sp. RHLX14]|uniref:H-NS histone family protein n=1 Tax=Variovorax sp. RHLX14 TaxID=1259731 RepID=UPI003F478843